MDLQSLVTLVASCIAIFAAICSIWWGARINAKTGLEIKKLSDEVKKANSRIKIPTEEQVKEIEKQRKENELERARREQYFKQLMGSMENDKSREMLKVLYAVMEHPEMRMLLMGAISGDSRKPKDFRNQNISGEYLFGLELDRSDFQNSIAEKADFRRASLISANFKGANLRNADFGYADLVFARFTEADVTDANFEKANLQDADFRGANGVDVHKLALASWPSPPKLDPELEAIARAHYPKKYK